MDQQWQYDDTYEQAYAPTDDPRVFAVIERDDYPDAPDGDAYAPAFQIDYPHRPDAIRSTYQDAEAQAIADAYQDVHAYAVNDQYRYDNGRTVRQRTKVSSDPDEFVRRYLRIFHDAVVQRVWNGGDSVLIVNSPGWREHIGIPVDIISKDTIEGDALTWAAYIDGEVYSIGYAVNEHRVLADGDVNPLTDDGWETEIVCSGFYGEDYAKQEAFEMQYDSPNLPEMLDLSGVAA